MSPAERQSLLGAHLARSTLRRRGHGGVRKVRAVGADGADRAERGGALAHVLAVLLEEEVRANPCVECLGEPGIERRLRRAIARRVAWLARSEADPQRHLRRVRWDGGDRGGSREEKNLVRAGV